MTSKGTILVVDDTLASLKLLADILAAEGYNIRPADSGELAMASVASSPPELILLDIRMPGMDGFEVCRRLKEQQESREIPVLFISATTAQEERVKGLKVGGVDFISKPFQREDLLARVGIHLELARLRTNLENQVAQRTAELKAAYEQLENELEERKQAEDELRVSETRFKSMFNEAPLGIAVVDSLNGRFYSVNAMFAKIAGRTVEELVQIDWMSITHPEDIQADLDKMAEMNAGKIPGFQMEKRYLRPDGSHVWINMTIAPMYVEDKTHPIHLLMIEEITERKRMEEGLKAAKLSAERAKEAAEESSRAKDRFLAILSHELRTPLTPVLALTSALVADESLVDALIKDIQTIHRNVELEARLIDDLLDVTRVVRGKIKLDKRPVDLGEIIKRAVEVCLEDIKVRRIHFGVKCEGEPYPILADTARLQQVFWNLLKNALKFTPKDGCIGIECRRVGQSVVAEVKDSGRGIAAEDLVRIFNPFEQIERRESGALGGLGLGLTLSKSLVELHGGTIEAKSEGLGLGATFCVTLPLVEESTLSIKSPALPSPPAHPRSLRILLVEDHGDTARILSRLLRNQGHEVRIAGDLKHALELSRQWEFDLLLSDLGLPDGNGRDLMRQLRSTRPKIPGIAISGFGTEEDIRQSLAVGFEEHLVKPLNIAALGAAIQRIAAKAA
ncbi:MAG: response regulator [Verrucomicrobia bacterium]|nr:response regulator [Verrucomicrobiota bacterium]